MTKSTQQWQQGRDIEAVSSKMGLAISAWSKVEDQLSHVFQTAMRAKDFAFAAEAFHAVVSLDARIAMLDAVVTRRTMKDETLQSDWAKLRNRIRKKAKKRNEIAHAMILSVNGPKGYEAAYAIPFFAVSKAGTLKANPRNIRDKKKLISQNQPMLSADQLVTRGEGFLRLRDEISAFHARLIEHMQSRKQFP